MIAYMISGEGNISIILKGNQYFISKGDSKYAAVLTAIKEGKTEDELIDIVDTAKKVADYMFDTDVKVVEGVLMYKDKEVHNTLAERIIAFMGEGLPTQPLVNFLKKLMANPSFSARKELFDFLSHKSLPITEDGDFLAYKAVRCDYFDKYTGKVANTISALIEMDRAEVDDDRNNGCSYGYHAGTLNYVFNQYGHFSDDKDTSDKCVIVKINPTDVVSVPSDCACEKLRTCKYLVLRDYEGEMLQNLYKDSGDAYEELCPHCGEPLTFCSCLCEDCGNPPEGCICG